MPTITNRHHPGYCLSDGSVPLLVGLIKRGPRDYSADQSAAAARRAVHCLESTNRLSSASPRSFAIRIFLHVVQRTILNLASAHARSRSVTASGLAQLLWVWYDR
jgi:hypothetical protein